MPPNHDEPIGEDPPVGGGTGPGKGPPEGKEGSGAGSAWGEDEEIGTDKGFGKDDIPPGLPGAPKGPGGGGGGGTGGAGGDDVVVPELYYGFTGPVSAPYINVVPPHRHHIEVGESSGSGTGVASGEDIISDEIVPRHSHPVRAWEVSWWVHEGDEEITMHTHDVAFLDDESQARWDALGSFAGEYSPPLAGGDPEWLRTQQETKDLADFGDFCEIPDTIEPDLPECPVCIPNPKAPLPNWTERSQDNPFLNEQTCEYWVTVQTTSPNMKNLPNETAEARESAVKSLLRWAGKDDAEDVILGIINQDIDGESAVQSPKNYLDSRRGTFLKILVTVPYDILEQARPEPLGTPKSETGTEDGEYIPPPQVTLYANDLNHMPMVINKAFNKYEKQKLMAIKLKELPFMGININTQGDYIKQFKRKLKSFLASNGYKIKSSRDVPLMEAVTVKFSEDFKQVIEVTANLFGCEGETFGGTEAVGKKWDKFVDSDPATTTTTLAFFARLPDIYNDVTARKPITVDNLLKKYWYPSLEAIDNFEPGQKLELLNEVDGSRDCNWKNFKYAEPLDALGDEVSSLLLSFPEMYAAAVVKNTCYTLEGRAVEDAKYKIFKDIDKRWKDAQKRKYFAGDGILQQCFAEEADPKDPSGDDRVEVQNLSELYKTCMDKLGTCGLIALIQEAMACVMKGLDLDTNLRVLLIAFIENATSSEMQGLFFKLNPGLQAVIKKIALEAAGSPLPWEAGYQVGSYSGPSRVNTEFSDKYGQNWRADLLFGTADDPIEDRIAKQDEFLKELDEEGSLKHTKLNKDGTLRKIQTEKSPGIGADRYGGGTVGKLADTIADEAFKAVKDAFIKAITDELISPEILMEALNDLPGGALVMQSLNSLKDCPPPHFFTPPLDDFLKTAEVDICKNHYALTLPVWNKVSVKTLMGSLKAIIIESAEEVLEKMVMRIILMIMSKLVNLLLNAPCDILADAAAIFKDIAGGSSLSEALANQLCDGADEGDVNAALNNLFDQWNVWDPTCPAPGTEEAVSHFMNGISSILTNDEAYSLLKGNASPAVYNYIMDVVSASPFASIKCAFPNPYAIEGAFAIVGQMVSLPDVKDFLSDDTLSSPVSPSICATDEGLQAFKDARAQMCIEQGLTEQECQEQMDLLNELAKQDLSDLAGASQGGLFNSLPNFVSDDPDCPENGLVPYIDEETLQAGSEVTKGIYNSLTVILIRELVTRRGLLNMILADTRGSGLKKHHEFYVNIFGDRTSTEANTGMFKFFNWFVDVNDDDTSDQQSHVFPDDVAPDLRNVLKNYEFDFDAMSFKHGKNNLILNYQTYPDHDNAEIDIFYNHYIVTENGQTIGDNLFSLSCKSTKDKLFPPFQIIAQRSIDIDVQDYINANNPYATTYKTLKEAMDDDLVPEAPTPNWLAMFNFRLDVDSDVDFDPEGIDAVEIQTSMQSNIFATYAQSKFGRSGNEFFNTFFKEDMFNYMTDAILKKFSFKISENARAFDFGYNKDVGPTIRYLTDYETYGGSPENQPFWIEPPKYGGWLGLYEDMIPEVDACEREPIINFREIGDIVDQYNRKFKNDERLQGNPACVVEPVYGRILTGGAAAGIEGAIRATVRLYIFEAIIKGMPVFSLFETQYPGTFDETLFSYLAMKIRTGLIETGRNIWGRVDLTKETYYYIFLEQVVQSFDRKVKLGEITPTNVEKEALDRIFQLQTLWVEPEICFNLKNIKFPARRAAIKECREKKRDQFVEYMIYSQNDALMILNRYIGEELDAVGEILKTALKPSVKNIPSLIFGSPQWMVAGSVSEGGPIDVPRNVLDENDISVEAILNTPVGSTIDKLEANKEDGYFPFVFEKYIKIKDYSEGIMIPSGSSALKNNILTRDINTKGIVNMELWKEYLDSTDWENLKVKDLFKKWYFGVRISFKMPMTTAVKSNGWSNFPFTDEECQLKESYKIGPDGDKTLIFPLIESEIRVSGNQRVSSDILDKFDLNCLVGEMIESTDYKTIFNYCLPLPGLLSLITIYTMETFVYAIGQEWDEYSDNNGVQGGANFSQFKRWDPQENFKRTKRILRKTFQSYYYSSDSEYKDPDEKNDEQKGREKLKIKKKFPSDKDIKRWQRKMQVPRPVETCPDGD